MNPVQKIVGFLSSQKENILNDLEEFAKIESPSNDPIHLFNAYHFLIREFKEVGYYTNWVPGKKSGGYLYARPKHRTKNECIQLLIGHTDTVWPLGTLKKMPVIIKENKITGPGVYDMKAGIIQLIYAIKALNNFNLKTTVLPVVIINSDEETGSKESTQIIKRLAKIASRAFILEPSLGYDGKLKTRRVGVGKYTISLKGKAAHAGLDPGKGASAIVELSHVIQKLFLLNEPKNGISVNVGMIDGGVRPNVVAPESSAIVDVRVPTNKDAMRIEEQILTMETENPEVELAIKGGIGRPPMEGTPANRILWQVAKNIGHELNIELTETSAGGGSDGNTTSQYTATLDGLGAIGDGAHADHEFAFQSKLIERSALLSLLLLEAPIDYSIN